MTTPSFDIADAIRRALRPEPHERMFDLLTKATAGMKPARREPRTRTKAQAMQMLGQARRPLRPRAAAGGEATVVRLDGEVGWDFTAQDLLDQLAGADAVELRISSPGGDVWEGIAAYNALKDHPGAVRVVVDGIAASAASFIAMAGDRVVMNRASQMMIHDALSMTVGNQNDHLQTAELLGRVSDIIAGIYSSRAGGTPEEWREAMRAETWYSATGAVEAGLADEAIEDEPPGEVDGAELVAAIRRGFR